MVRVNRYILVDLDIVYALQNGEPVTDTCNTHFLELIMFQGDECLPDYLIFCTNAVLASQ